VLVQQELRRPLVAELVEGLVVEAAAVREEEGEGDPEVERQVVPQGVLQAVPDRQVAHWADLGPEALPRLRAELAVPLQPAKSVDPLG
jgi:hypothetical protein